jgi:hypothetical protein
MTLSDKNQKDIEFAREKFKLAAKYHQEGKTKLRDEQIDELAREMELYRYLRFIMGI